MNGDQWELEEEWQKLRAERDAAIARAEKAERERDEARAGILGSHFGDMLKEVQAQAERAEAELAKLREVLNIIASWSEGDTVNTGFDCPSHAELARAALAAVPNASAGKDGGA